MKNNKPRKVKISHHEVDVKLFLEILAIYFILALVLTGIFLLEPTITGFITVAKLVNHTDDVNQEFNETSEYVWNLQNPGNLKSIKIDGSKSKEGEAKIYIENDGVRYLIFDSSKLVETQSGFYGITGFVVAENASNETSKGKPETPRDNNPPVWKADVDELIIDGETLIDLNDYYSDKNNDTIYYSISSPDNIEVSLNNNLVVFTPLNNNFNTTINITATDGDKSTTKEITLIIPHNKIISINLEYKSGSIYDVDDDGVETTTGIIDLTVENTNFNWDVDESNLCTRWEVYSVENQESTFACFGNVQCCAFVDLQNSRDIWNDNLFLTFGSYGSGFDNIVSSQVLHVDFDLSSEQPYSDVVISEQANLTAKFTDDIIEFGDVCIETCAISGFNASSYKLIVEIEGGELTIDKIDYIIEERLTNQDPLFIKNIENISIIENKNHTLDLSLYFSDEDDDKLIYSYFEIDNITISFEDDLAYIIPDEGFVGNRFTFITANDSFGSVLSNVFKIEIIEEIEPAIQILDSASVGENWTVSFNTIGTGTLIITAINSTYAEFYNDNVTTINDLDILELKCGEFEIFSKDKLIETENSWFVLENNSKVKLIDLVGESLSIISVYVDDYVCNEIGQYTVKVLANGTHTQEFNFENKTVIVKNIPYAEQTIDLGSDTFEIRDEKNNLLVVFDSSGNVNIKGFLTQNITLIADDDDFVIENVNDSPNLVITNPEGNMLLKGNLNENQDLLVPTPDSFILENKTRAIVVYVNSTGSLFLRGKLTERVSFE